MTGWLGFLVVFLCTSVLVTASEALPTLQSEKDYDACRESVREQADLCRREAIIRVIYNISVCAMGGEVYLEECVKLFRDKDVWGSSSDCDKSSYDICASQREQLKKDQQEQWDAKHSYEHFLWSPILRVFVLGLGIAALVLYVFPFFRW